MKRMNYLNDKRAESALNPLEPMSLKPL